MKGRGLAIALGALMVVSFAAVSAPSFAQVDGALTWRQGGCANCHGGIGQGGGGGEEPEGPNLHESDLDRASLRELIACGRGEMPINLAAAYVTVECYGIPLGQVPEGFQRGATFDEERLDTLVDFLLDNVLGVSINRTACAAFYGGDVNSPACRPFPR